MEKVDVAVQSFKKPESLVYTLLSLKKHCGEHIDTIYINDDCSGGNVVDYYRDERLLDMLKPINVKIRVNKEKGGWTNTVVTKEVFQRKNLVQKIQLLLSIPARRANLRSSTDEIRYQWALNNTNKKYLFIMHDDIKFNGDVIGVYLDELEKNQNMAIVGDFAGSPRCPFGPCGEKECSPRKVLDGYRPCKSWPVTSNYLTPVHMILGRRKRNCRVNEWCCMLNVNIAKDIGERYGTFFGNNEFGGDTAAYWFDRMLKAGYSFNDPISYNDRISFYQHCWQGNAGHSVWVKQESDSEKAIYKKEFIKECLEKEFGYKME